MSSCCNNKAKKEACPGCGQPAAEVKANTLLFQLRHPHNQQLQSEHYFFCSNADCDIVYFADNESYNLKHCRTAIGQKSHHADRMLCYCFDISESDFLAEIAQHGKSHSQAFISRQTKNKTCHCEIRNPSGKCCLKDFKALAV